MIDSPSSIEQGWHQFSIPPYPAGSRPTLFCWCGAALAMPMRAGRAVQSPDLTRFLSAHAACSPDGEYLLKGGSAHVYP